MTGLVSCLSSVISSDSAISLRGEHIAKLAPFLVAGDLAIRLQATKLVELIIDRVAYDNDYSLTVVVSNVSANLIREAMTDILEASLELFEKLLTLPQTFSYITNSDVPYGIFELTLHNDKKIIQKALTLLHQMLIGTAPSAKIVVGFVNRFKRLTSDPSLQAASLSILQTLLSSPLIYKEIASNNGTIDAFKQCFSSPDSHVIAKSLKLCFGFLSNPISFPQFSVLTSSLAQQLCIEIPDVAALSAACLTAIANRNGPLEIIKDSTGKKTAAFLNSALILNDTQNSDNAQNSEISQNSENIRKLTIPALRLSGVISGSFSGAIFLEKCNVLHKIKELLGLIKRRN